MQLSVGVAGAETWPKRKALLSDKIVKIRDL